MRTLPQEEGSCVLASPSRSRLSASPAATMSASAVFILDVKGKVRGQGIEGPRERPRAQDPEPGTRPLQPASAARGFTSCLSVSLYVKWEQERSLPYERPEPVSTALLQTIELNKFAQCNYLELEGLPSLLASCQSLLQ